MQATQTVKFTVECSASIEASAHWDDYGVPGSPRWISYEPEDFADSTVDIAGVTCKLSELPKDLRDELYHWAIEELKEDKWE